jgi:hypothetical protein
VHKIYICGLSKIETTAAISTIVVVPHHFKLYNTYILLNVTVFKKTGGDERDVRHSDSLINIPHWPLPAVCDLTRDGRLSTYDESVLKLSKVSSRVKCARMGHPLRLPSPTKRLSHFSPASQAGRLAGPVFYTITFRWRLIQLILYSVHHRIKEAGTLTSSLMKCLHSLPNPPPPPTSSNTGRGWNVKELLHNKLRFT